MRKSLQLFLILILLGGQTALLAHQLDRDAHAGGQSCEVCVQGSALDHAEAAAGLAFAPPARDYPALASLLVFAPVDCAVSPGARAPPRSSS